MKTAAALTVFALLIVALVSASVVGANRISSLYGVTAIHANADRVFVGFEHEVFVADHGGSVLGKARDPDGEPWRFESVSGITTDASGNLYVADGKRGEVLRFDADGAAGAQVPLRGERPQGFEIAIFPDGTLVLGETLRHRVSTVSPTGERLRTIKIKYPNGLSIGPGVDRAPALYLAETGAVRIHAFDSKLERIEPPPLQPLRDLIKDVRARGSDVPHVGPELLDFALTSDGKALAHFCRDTEGDCTIVRLDPTGPRAIAVGDFSVVRAGLTDWARSLMLAAETAPGPNGRVYAASMQLGTVLEFEPPAEGTAFCTDCRPTAMSALMTDLNALSAAPVLLPNGTRVSIFGDASLRARFDSEARARTFYEGLESVGRVGVFATALALLVLLFVMRQSGAVDARHVQDRAIEVWRRIVAPDARVLLSSGGLVIAAAAAGGGLGWLILGESVAVATAVGAAVLVARTAGQRFLLDRRKGTFASEAWEVQLSRLPAARLDSGEVLQWVHAARRSERLSNSVREAKAASEATDPLEIIENIAPKLTVIACTNQRLLLVDVSALGAPIDALRSAKVELREGDRPGLTLISHEASTHFDAPALREHGLSFVARELRYLCERCGGAVGTCVHTGARSAALAVLLSGLFPGLGHLVQYRFRRARVVMLVALSLLMAGVYTMIPQLVGALPYEPAKFIPSLVAFGVVLIGSILDVVSWSVKQRRRAAANEEQDRDESSPDYAGFEVS